MPGDRAEADPKRAAELVDAGIAAETRGDPIAAENLFRAAVAADSGNALAHMNLGIALQARGDATAAAHEHASAVRLDPKLASAHYNLARACLDLEDSARAEDGFRQALRLRPEFPEAWVGLAEVLESTSRDDAALEALSTAIAQRAHYVGALFNAAMLLRRLGRLDEAEARLRDVPNTHPEYANAMTALAAILRDQGRVEEAIEVLREVLAQTPQAANANDELLFTLCFSDRVSESGLFDEHARAGARAESVALLQGTGLSNNADPDRVLNIGYMSGDFRHHSVALFIEHLFERHRRDRVRIHAYSSTPQHDDMTGRFIRGADVWRDMRGQTDAAVAVAILNDGVDILVDLSGHTSPARIGVLAAKPAPLQMTWMGSNNTTGLTRVDYRITDNVCDLPGLTESLHTERLLRMPVCQWCFRPPQGVRNLEPARDSAVRSFTFGALNQFAKVSDSTISLWIDVLREVPSSRLRIGSVPRGSATEALAKKLAQAGIDLKRIDIFPRGPVGNYYLHYRHVDACLDTFPYSGCTTTCDAFWFGVPVITLAGNRSVSRSTASLLAAIGRSDLIAQSREAFVAIAARLAANESWSTRERLALRNRFLTSPLTDEQGFAHALEALYRQAWREWCANR